MNPKKGTQIMLNPKEKEELSHLLDGIPRRNFKTVKKILAALNEDAIVLEPLDRGKLKRKFLEELDEAKLEESIPHAEVWREVFGE